MNGLNVQNLLIEYHELRLGKLEYNPFRQGEIKGLIDGTFGFGNFDIAYRKYTHKFYSDRLK